MSKERKGLLQPWAGICSILLVTLTSLIGWWIFADIRGPLALYQDDGQPFFMIIVWILVVMHVIEFFFDGMPYRAFKPGAKRMLVGLVTVLGISAVVILAIQFFWGRLGMPFLSWPALMDLGVSNYWAREVSGLANLILGVTFLGVMLLWKTLFGNWPFDDKLSRATRGFAQLCVVFTFTVLIYIVVMYPFFGLAFDPVQSYMSARPWWTDIADTVHVNFVLGWWEWGIVFLFMINTIWEKRPMNSIKRTVPRALMTFAVVAMLTVIAFKACLTIYELSWGPAVSGALREKAPYWRYLHVAEQAGFVLFPMVSICFFFNNGPRLFKTEELNWLLRTVLALALGVVVGIVFYLVSEKLLGIPGGTEISNPYQYPLLWMNWWVLNLLVNVWIGGRWPFFATEPETAPDVMEYDEALQEIPGAAEREA